MADGNLEHGKPAGGRFGSAVRRLIWLDERLVSVRRSAFGVGKPGWAEYQLARSALSRGDTLRLSSGAVGPSALLYRAAVRLLMAARVSALSAGLLERASAPEPDESLAEILGEGGEGVLARLEPAKSLEATLSLCRLALALLAPFARDVAAVRRVQLARWSRVGLIMALALGGVALALRRPNLAFGRIVSVSQTDAGYTDIAHLVDGETRQIAFHSSGPAPHLVTIDLGAERVVSQVVVHNRQDCCAERAVPLQIELGADGRTFRQVAQRDGVFNIWRASFPATRGRFVRLVSKNSAPFHLSEVEVY